MKRNEAVERLLDCLRQVWSRYRYVLLVALAGAALLLLPTGKSGEQGQTAALSSAAEWDVSELEERLERALARVDGAGEVEVVLTVERAPRQILAEDRVSERDGESLREEETTVVLSRGSGVQEAVAVGRVSAQFRGALVVCSGGEDPQVRLALAQAVSAVTGLGTDRISICKGK